MCSRSELEPIPMWSDALGVLKTALELSQVSATREAYLEAELLLNIGKVLTKNDDKFTGKQLDKFKMVCGCLL